MDGYVFAGFFGICNSAGEKPGVQTVLERCIRPIVALDLEVTTEQVQILETPPSEDWVSPISEI